MWEPLRAWGRNNLAIFISDGEPLIAFGQLSSFEAKAKTKRLPSTEGRKRDSPWVLFGTGFFKFRPAGSRKGSLSRCFLKR